MSTRAERTIVVVGFRRTAKNSIGYRDFPIKGVAAEHDSHINAGAYVAKLLEAGADVISIRRVERDEPKGPPYPEHSLGQLRDDPVESPQ